MRHLLIGFVCICLQCVLASTVTSWHYSGINIAIRKNTKQTPGTYDNRGADLAVDGNTSTRFDDGSCSHTLPKTNSPASWTVFLGRSYYISGIVILNRNEHFQRVRLSNFTVTGNGSYVLYNDTGKYRYNALEIKIPLDGKHSFSSVSVTIPAHEGYPDGGKSILTLCEVEIYAAKFCGSVSQPLNGHITMNNGLFLPYKTYPPGIIFVIQCNKDYRINGDAVIACLQDGHYNASFPTCDKAKCEGFQPQNHTHFNPDWPSYPINTTLLVTCEEGYTINSTTNVIRCGSSGKWDNPVPRCYPVQCEFPGEPLNGYYMKISSQFNVKYSFSTLPYQSLIEGKCNHGYESTFTYPRKCNSIGTWTGQNLICSPVKCNSPGDIKDGVYVFNNGSKYTSGTIVFNETLRIKCNTGYQIEGWNQMKCQGDKTWSLTEPICTVKKCKVPVQFLNGFYEFKRPYAQDNSDSTPLNETLKLEYLTKINVKCNVGYVFNSTNKSRTCLESGKWSGETPECVPVHCKWPLQLNGGYYVSSHNSTDEGMPFNTTLTALCNKKFKLLYSFRRLRCDEDGHWINESAICEPFDADKQTKDNVGMTIGVAVTVPLVLFSGLAVAVFFCRRRKKSAAVKKGNGPKGNDNSAAPASSWLVIDNKVVSRESAQMENQNNACSNASFEIAEEIPIQKDQTYYNLTDEDNIPKSAIKVKDLSEFVLHGKNTKEKFEIQFKGLPQGMTKTYTEAVLSKNRGKNRYRALYAYDDTRVVLETDEASETDYINACYVHGYDKIQKYIASQGPTKEVLEDFWKMVWQEDCCKIIMLTNLSEEGKTKCEQYWPDKDSETYGKITVTMKTTEIFSQFIIRTLKIQKNNSESRLVTQFHFTAWPDKGVPKYASSLVHFLHKVKHTHAVSAGPTIVHCSAGIGRTGTFIALDILTEQGNAMEYVDVLRTVSTLRQQRVNLVQTLEQYIFVHQALVESLMLPTSALSAAKFPEAYKDLLKMDETRGKRKICVEFETLNKVSPAADESQYVSSKLVRNRQKNRYSNILPEEGFMPTLSSSDGIRDSSYINAVFLPSYKEKKAFIITQSPLESTKNDFWRLIWEHNVHTMVMMNNQDELQGSEIYWPNETEIINFGHIEIRNDGSEKINNHQVLSLTIKNKEQVLYIKLFQCGGWQSEENLPDSPDVILELMELVLMWQQQSGNHTVLVHCLNGVDKSGLFCVISAVIERMKIEQDVAIPQVIQEMRNARQQIIPSVEQYMFCHEAVLTFLNKYDTYANFAA